MMDVRNFRRILDSKAYCHLEHQHIIEEGGCIDRGSDDELALLETNVEFMNARVHRFAADWQGKLKAQNRSDVAIVAQPFFEGTGALWDSTFVSSLDCMHPSTKAHEDLAIGLWNS